MGKKSTRAVPRERIDYTQLLAELQAESAVADSIVTAPISTEDHQALTPFRQRLMSDEHILYFYSEPGGEVHDKTCPRVREILDQDLRWSKSYPNHLPQCSLCWLKAYVRLGARDLFRSSDYERLFAKMGMPPQCQRQFEIVRKRRRNCVVFRRGGNKTKRFLAQKECSRFTVSDA